jgi:lipocalin
MSLETKIVALAQAVGADIKALTASQGSLSSLNTTAKTSLVAAINELVGLVGSAGAQINDAAGDGSTAVTWSADKIYDSIEAAKAAVKADLTAGASAAMDTLNELAAALGNDPNFAATIATEIANRVRFDSAQTLTAPQKAQARANIGAGTSDLVIGTTSTTAKAGNYAPTWAEVTSKPAVIAAGADAAAARATIGAGTSNLAVGTTASTAKAGNYVPTWAEVTSKPAVIAAGASAAAARTAIGAADDANLTALVTAVGDTERDLVAVYTTAKA